MSDLWALARKTAVNTSLALASLLLCTAASEGYLRFFHPVYEYAADAPYYLDHRRIYARKAHSMYTRPHPDTGLRHSVIHNNLALRQHRDFSEEDLADAVNIGVFGDSFTENLRLPAQYSFVDVLDFLLSQASYQGDTGQRFNVLNLGVEGYGTDQAFLYYEDFVHSSKLDVVLYLFCSNDLENIHENKLLSVNEFGALTSNTHSGTASSPWISLLSGFHTTYLVIDGTKHIANLIGEDIPDFMSETRTNFRTEWMGRQYGVEAEAVRADIQDGTADSEHAKVATGIFQSILRTWHRRLQDHDGRLVVAVLPRLWEQHAAELIPPEIQTTSLLRCFNEHVTEYDYRPPWRFVNDSHWAEQGNMLAAMCLYRFLEENLDLPARSDDELLAQIYRYYLAFRNRIYPGAPISQTSTHPVDSADLELPRDRLHDVITTRSTWMPPDEWIRPVAVRPEELTAIRMKYLAAEISPTAAVPTANIANTRFDRRVVYGNRFSLYLTETALVYIKNSCTPSDVEPTFFLHIYPVDVNDLPYERRTYGFDNWDGRLLGRLDMLPDDVCFIRIPLPSYDIARIRTGQQVPGGERIWDETIVPDTLRPT